MTPARAGVCISLIEQTPKHRILSSGYLLSVTPLYRCKKQESKGLKPAADGGGGFRKRSEEHTSELQSLRHLVCRLLLEKKKNEEHTPSRDQVKQERGSETGLWQAR